MGEITKEEFYTLREGVKVLETRVNGIESDMNEVRTDIKSSRQLMIGAVITALINAAVLIVSLLAK